MIPSYVTPWGFAFSFYSLCNMILHLAQYILLTSPDLTCSWPVLIPYQLFVLTTSLLYLPPRLPFIHFLSVRWFRQSHSALPQYSTWSCFSLIIGLSGFPEIELSHIQIFCLMLFVRLRNAQRLLQLNHNFSKPFSCLLLFDALIVSFLTKLGL